MDRFADYVAAKRGMADTLRALVAAGTVTSSDTRQRLTAAIEILLAAGAAAGRLREDVEAADVFAALTGIFLATEYVSDPSLERLLGCGSSLRVGGVLDVALVEGFSRKYAKRAGGDSVLAL